MSILDVGGKPANEPPDTFHGVSLLQLNDHVYHQLKCVKCGNQMAQTMYMYQDTVSVFACKLSTPLAQIFKTSLTSEVIPSLWKRASPALVNKLRPIALTTVLEGYHVAKWTI